MLGPGFFVPVSLFLCPSPAPALPSLGSWLFLPFISAARCRVSPRFPNFLSLSFVVTDHLRVIRRLMWPPSEPGQVKRGPGGACMHASRRACAAAVVTTGLAAAMDAPCRRRATAAWVSVNGTAIGYFPHTMFPTFFPESYINQVGGVVHNSRPNGMHTDTTMGSGRMPNGGGSAVVKGYLAIAANGVDKKDKPIRLGVTAPKCYNVAVLGENRNVPSFDIAYGGAGSRGCDQ
ncbi:hypothetical protein HU200_054315 [Digitaria exilis]|uniref:Neprosin PEP catalytic domain-containing protein n=1 Tax=Digitaria exilis TaxID=1010633 RepID=A0A835E2R0_9POAL|nr:hypothetical protein HU200_054315 [Digitaria exilis]